jgi:hypothetical protein
LTYVDVKRTKQNVFKNVHKTFPEATLTNIQFCLNVLFK